MPPRVSDRVTRDRHVLAAGFVAWCAGSFALWRAAWAFTIDDAFISARYAQQWVAGNGLVFNIGDRVEGFSNFTWVCLLAVLEWLKVPFEPGVKVLGLLAASLTVLGMLCILTRRLHVRDIRLAAAAGLWVGVDPAFAVWTVGGLETPLFAALIVWATYLWLDPDSHGGLHEGLLATTLSALAWTRPEGPAFVVGFYVLTIFLHDNEAVRKSRRIACTFALMLVGFGFLARYAYYGDSWPNPYYVKLGGGFEQIKSGAGYWLAAIGRRGGPLLLAWIALPFFARVLDIRARRAHLTLVLITLGYSLFIIRAGREPFPFHRFVVPMIPLMVVSGFAGAQALVQRRPTWRYPVVFGACACAAAMPLSAGGHWRQVAEHIRITHEISVPLGSWVGKIHRGDPNVSVAVFWAGALPYAAGPSVKAIDMGGLCDRHIAKRSLPWDERNGGHVKHDFPYVLAQAPTLVTDDALHKLDDLASLEGDRAEAYGKQRDLFLRMYTRLTDDVFVLGSVDGLALMERYTREHPEDSAAAAFQAEFLRELAHGRELVQR